MKFDKNSLNTPSIKFEKGFSQESKIIKSFDELRDHLILVVAGRSNVGKSSFINQLLKDKLAKTSKTPGRTQEVNLFSFSYRNTDEKIYLFDLPGYGYAKISKELKRKWDSLLSSFFANLPESALVFQIQDAKVPGQSADIEFLNFAAKARPETYLIFNKIDKLKNQKEKAKMKVELDALLKRYLFIQGNFQTSVPKNIGFDDIRKFIYNLVSNDQD
jgi:GTP-binding protein